MALPMFAPYACSKFGVEALSDCLRVELAGQVGVVLPNTQAHSAAQSAVHCRRHCNVHVQHQESAQQKQKPR